MHWFYFTNDGRYYFASHCGHDFSYDHVEHMVYEDWLDFEGGGRFRSIPVSKLPLLFRPEFSELIELLSVIYP